MRQRGSESRVLASGPTIDVYSTPSREDTRLVLSRGLHRRASASRLTHGHNSDVNRAVLSHLKAQAEGSAQWFEHGRTQAPLSTWGIHVFDDASMWMRQPTAIPKRRSLSAPSRMERNLSKRGWNIRLPVLTLTEHILQTPAFASRRPCRMLAPVSPCMPMAAANWHTIQNHWKKWTLTNG